MAAKPNPTSTRICHDPGDAGADEAILFKDYRRGGVGEGPLLVAPIIWAAEHAPTVSKNAVSRGADFWMISGTAGLVVVWLVLRRLTRRTTGGASARRGELKPAGENDADFDWLLRTQADAAPDKHRQDSGTGRF